MKFPLCLLALLILGVFSPLQSATLFVDVAKGNDSNPGTQEAPFKTTGKGIKTAQPGDTVLITKVDFPIREMLAIQNKSGEPGQPITIDGQGNLFTGCDPLKPEDWTEVKPGVFRNDHLVRGLTVGSKSNAATIQRYYMMWDGVQNRMGRSSKGFQPELPAPDQLKPGEWTYVDSETAFYIAIDPAKKLADYRIETPVRQNGAGIGGTCKHWVLRNINATHVINDGFNIHGHTEDFVFENITSTECGDDGISAHEDCEITIHGFVSRRNSTGMAHEPGVTTTDDHLVLEDNYGCNLLLYNVTGKHSIANSTISAKAPEGGKNGIVLLNEARPANSVVLVRFDNCQIPFPPDGTNSGNRPAFLVDGGIQIEISPDTKVGGPISYLPSKQPK